MSQNAPKIIDQHEQEVRIQAYKNCRGYSLTLCDSLSPEDHMIQGASFASPPKWHLGHTNWFFATFILEPLALAPTVPTSWKTLFNSYYNGLGQPHARAQRGILSRPALADILQWRELVDQQILNALNEGLFSCTQLQLIDLGIQHEMQHQELLLTDLLYSFSLNSSHPLYDTSAVLPSPAVSAIEWLEFNPGLVEIGAGTEGFAFDNEHPRHRHFLEPYAIADRLVTSMRNGGSLTGGIQSTKSSGDALYTGLIEIGRSVYKGFGHSTQTLLCATCRVMKRMLMRGGQAADCLPNLNGNTRRLCKHQQLDQAGY